MKQSWRPFGVFVVLRRLSHGQVAAGFAAGQVDRAFFSRFFSWADRKEPLAAHSADCY